MQNYPGLRFEKFDLHVHTPASHDFSDKEVTPEQIVEHALKKGLRGIAITDHSTGAFIDKVKEAAKNKALLVIPGVEVCCTGGKAGIHIIALLDTNKGSKHIDALLSAIGISADDFGKKDAVTTKAPFEVIEIIASPMFEGIAVLAHCSSSKGVLHDITGKTRQRIFENDGLLAVETSTANFQDTEKQSKSMRVIDILDGNDPNYNYRRLAVYIASDSHDTTSDKPHSLSGIGSVFTLLKVDEEPNLESLRQCFIDRDVRIRQHFELSDSVYPMISNISVTGGFFDTEKTSFHNGLNSILGAKGAGKSLLIELMRFGLNASPNQKDILNDHKRKLERRLETYGTVCLNIVDETGTEFQLERTFNEAENNPFREDHELRIANSFGALFLSQNEIVKIAEDERQQIEFIDRFFDFRHFKARIKTIETDLAELDIKFANGIRSYQTLSEVKKNIKIGDDDLNKLDKKLSDPIYDHYKKLEKKDQALKLQMDALSELKTKVDQYIESLEEIKAPAFEEAQATDPAIKRNKDLIVKTITETIKTLKNAIENIENAVKSADSEYKKWESVYKLEKKEYQKKVQTAGGDRKALESQRIRLVKDLTELKKREQLLTEKSQGLKRINQERDEKIKKLYDIYREYSDERKQKCKKFEKESNGRLLVSLNESTNVDEFKNQLKSLKKGSYLRDSEIEKLCDNIKPHDFILNLLRYQTNKDDSILSKIAEESSIEIDHIRSLSEFLLSQIKYEDLLALQYRARPEDRPDIKYKIAENHYESIKDISVGQKCTAMLIMALSDGKFPIIIDQPEDSLDVRSVWDDMCTKIRRGKDKRQFIFTTHNSCLAVASDTDKYTIIESDAVRGHISISGALESGDMKEEVICYLEGGRPTYLTKAAKYGRANIKIQPTQKTRG